MDQGNQNASRSWRTLTLEQLSKHSADLAIVLNLDHHVDYINHEIGSFAPGEVIGTSIYDHVPESDQETIQRCLEQALTTRRVGTYDSVSKAPGTELVRHWETRVLPLEVDGEVVGFGLFARDVTERNERMVEFERFFDLSLEFMCIANADGYFTRVNRAFTRILGYSPEELLETPFAALLHPADVEETLAACQRVIAGQEVVGLENRYRARDGSYRLLSWQGRPDPTRTRILAVARDITEQRAIEKQLHQSQKMDAVGQLAGGIAHDFNNLMLAVLANAEFAGQELLTGQDEVREYLAEIDRAGQRAAALTQQLLAFSRRGPISPQPMDLNGLIRNLIKMLRRLIPEDIEIDFVPGFRLPKIAADPGQLEQVLMNLCVNARDAMPDGGRLTIETEPVFINGRYRETHPWAKPGRYVLLSVTDTGHGMTADVKERLFEPFFTTKEPTKGTGLGLATAYAIIKQHGGLIHVYSEPGEGSSFKVYLPISARGADEIDPKKDEGLPDGRETILVAEDEPLVRNVIVQILERAGYRVLCAANGHEAVKLLRAHRASVDLAILDVVMPELSGPETYTQLLELEPGLPVLFSSGYTDSSRFATRVPAGKTLLAKPYRSEDLLKQVRAALRDRPSTMAR